MTEPELPDVIESQIAAALTLPSAARAAALRALREDHPSHAVRIDRLVAQLRELDVSALRTRGAESVIDQITLRADRQPHVRLDDREGNPEPAGDEEDSVVGKYVVGRRLGRGGVGEVVRGHDRDLNRDVALKFLREDHRDKPAVIRRFVEEAQIGGQLQHPGVVPVYDLGISQGIPFFAMKLVKGETLADLLRRRASPAEERQRFLQIFLQVCQTVAFAHARGVIHRDLKPQNVMVGRYGEVQVVDWGMGKVLGQSDDERRADGPADTAASVVDTLRSDTPGSDSLPGSILGTPAYMSPEQAVGDVAGIGKPADVFGLGAVLCEILTGTPPYVTDETDSDRAQGAILVMAARARLDDALDRLARCGAEPEVVDLCRRCLAVDVSDRPADADEVARGMGEFLAHVDARAQAARIEAAISNRQKRLLAVIVLIIVAALGATGWLWQSAEAARGEAVAQRAIADLHAVEIGEQKELVEREKARVTEANRRFRLLGWRARLDQRLADIAELVPPWPHRTEDLRAWLADAREVAAAYEEVRDARDDLRARAAPPTSDDLAPMNTYLDREVAVRQRRLGALRRAAAVRAGAVVHVPDLDEETRAKPLDELNEIAWRRVAPDAQRDVYGEEAYGLAVARHVLEQAELAGVERSRFATFHDTLAWACLACGLDDDARHYSDAAIELAGSADRAEYERFRKAIGQQIESAAGAQGALAITRLEAEIRHHEELALDARRWRFADDSDEFLHRALQRLVRDLEEFTGPRGAPREIEQRLRWAGRVFDVSIEQHRDAWAAAAAAIRDADGETASTRYRSEPRLVLPPQLGLVPIGMNPVTKLWEFYHLRSAWAPESDTDPGDLPVPRFDAGGGIAMGDETGMVFVLVPGGTFWMGAQNADESEPNFDPAAKREEAPHEQRIEPFFLARHELTQRQWSRLRNGDAPSYYPDGTGWREVEITGHNPVEQVDWFSCTELAAAYGLRLPSDAEWEYACRAGTTTPWSTGATPASLAGHANILDDSGAAAMPGWGRSAGFDDGFVVHAPVGSFAPNAWGLFDMHGNLWEWTSTPFGASGHTHRGGSFAYSPASVRSAYRGSIDSSFKNNNLGVRLARSLQPAGSGEAR